MSHLISFVIALSTCEAYDARRKRDFQKNIFLPTVGLEATTSRLLDWRSNKLHQETTSIVEIYR